MVTLSGAIAFWLKHSKVLVKITPLPRYPKVTIGGKAGVLNDALKIAHGE